MEFARERELVHLRYELRRLLADRRRDEAAPLLDRLRAIAAADAREAGETSSAALGPEIDRWASTFRLEI
jgi:hypothetical protein